MKPMGNLGDIKRGVILLLGIGQSLLQIFAWLAHPAWNLDKGDNLFLQVFVAQQAVHSLHKHVDTLVAELVASTGGDEQRVVVELFAQQSIGNVKHLAACGLALAGKLLCRWHKAIVETIRKHHINRLIHQFHTFTGCDVAHGGKAIHMMSGLFLD